MRAANGAVDIRIPEVRVWVRDGQARVDAVGDYRSSAVVRELMVLAGEGAARWAFGRGLPFPYYSQEAPGSQEGLPPGLAGEFAKRRLMRAGMAGAQPRAHQGLGVSMYAQVTSPLRRYADLLGHQQIRAALAADRGEDAAPPLPADELSMRLARAAAGGAALRKAERQSEAHWTLAYLLSRPAWEGRGVVVQTGNDAVHRALDSLGVKNRFHIHLVEELTGLCRVENVAGLINAELLEDHGELFLEHFSHPVFDRSIKNEVDRSHRIGLPDTIHSPNALLQPHGIPWDVVIDDDVTELQVQAFSARIRGNENPGVLGKCILNPLALVHVHRPVQAYDGKASLGQESP